LEGCTRPRFLALSRRNTWTNGLGFAELVPFPLGKKGYNGRVERSHCPDDKEFYLRLKMRDERELSKRTAQWLYYYNVERPHTG